MDDMKGILTHANLTDGLMPVGIFIIGYLQLRRDSYFLVAISQQHLVEVLILFDALTFQADDESVPKRLQTLALCRQLVTGRNEQFQRQADKSVAVAEDLFVDDRKQRVLDRRPGFPYLVEEDDVGGRQIAFCDTLVIIGVLQFTNAHGTEDLIGRRELRHEILKRAGTGKSLRQPPCHHALCHSRRAKQDDALPGHGCQQRQGYLVLLLIDALVQCIEKLFYPFLYHTDLCPELNEILPINTIYAFTKIHNF